MEPYTKTYRINTKEGTITVNIISNNQEQYEYINHYIEDLSQRMMKKRCKEMMYYINYTKRHAPTEPKKRGRKPKILQPTFQPTIEVT